MRTQEERPMTANFKTTDYRGRNAQVWGAHPAEKRVGYVCFIPATHQQGAYLNVAEATRLRDWLTEQIEAMSAPRYVVRHDGRTTGGREVWSVRDDSDGLCPATFRGPNAKAHAHSLAEELNNG